MSDRDRLICGERESPDGAILVPFSLAGPNESELCENPVCYRIGIAKIYLEERLTNDPNTLELLTEERKRSQNALFCCGVHKDCAKDTWRYRERESDSSEYPIVEKLDR